MTTPRQPGLYVVFDEPPSHKSGRFVEVEDDTGASVHAAEWRREGDLWALGPFHTADTEDRPMTTPRPEPSRYELLNDDPRFRLSKGDILICAPMHWAWAHEKVAVVRRESDGYEPGCSQYRGNVRHVSGPRA